MPAPRHVGQRSFDAFRDREDGVCSTRWLPAGILPCGGTPSKPSTASTPPWRPARTWTFAVASKESGRALLSDSRLRSDPFGYDPATLRQVFKTELWHGRDNLKVSLSSGLLLSDLPSIVIPMIGLGLLGMTVAGLATVPIGGWLVSGAALSAFGGLAALRAAKMLQRGKHVSSSTTRIRSSPWPSPMTQPEHWPWSTAPATTANTIRSRSGQPLRDHLIT